MRDLGHSGFGFRFWSEIIFRNPCRCIDCFPTAYTVSRNAGEGGGKASNGSIPSLKVKTERLCPIDGLMPDPTNPPSGCRFHERCPGARSDA